MDKLIEDLTMAILEYGKRDPLDAMRGALWVDVTECQAAIDAEIKQLRARLAQSWQPLVEETVELEIGTVEVAGATLVILNDDGSYKADVIMDDAHAFCHRAAPDPLGHIVEAVRRENAYQDTKRGTIEDNPHHIYEWAELVFEEAGEAYDARHRDNRETLREILQVVSTGIACLKQHGVVERQQPDYAAVQRAMSALPGDAAERLTREPQPDPIAHLVPPASEWPDDAAPASLRARRTADRPGNLHPSAGTPILLGSP